MLKCIQNQPCRLYHVLYAFKTVIFAVLTEMSVYPHSFETYWWQFKDEDTLLISFNYQRRSIELNNCVSPPREGLFTFAAKISFWRSGPF